jgi:hypothetical protein
MIGNCHKTFLGLRGCILVVAGVVLAGAPASARVNWIHKSTTTADLPTPNGGAQQTCAVVLDVDGDGIDDFVIGERTRTPSVVWYKYNGKGWSKYVIDDSALRPEAGGAAYDITGNGYPDLVLGQDTSGNAIWWWENPAPDFTKPWKRRLIKNSGGHKHHDQTFGDFTGDGRAQLVSWSQRDKKLLLYRIPDAPRSTEPWPSTTIYQWTSGPEREGFPSVPADINGDGKLNIVGGGRWFEHIEGDRFAEHIIDEKMAFTQCAVGQLVEGGRPEIVFSPGDTDGMAKWYQWDDQKWVGHDLTFVRHGHTCEIADIDGDGHLDILIGEMGRPGAGDDAKIYIWYGDGQGNFEKTVAWHGQGIHEGRLGDFNGDGRLDILLKPYSHNAPRVDVLLNGGTRKITLDQWKRHYIGDLPHRAVFVHAGDINGNGRMDRIAGGWWWENPGAFFQARLQHLPVLVAQPVMEPHVLLVVDDPQRDIRADCQPDVHFGRAEGNTRELPPE